MTTVLVCFISSVLSGIIIYFAFKPAWLQRKNAKRLSETGIGEVGLVLEIHQTGTEVNLMPEMEVTLDIHPAGGTRRQVKVTQLLDLAAIPRVGDSVYLVADPMDPSLVLIAGAPKIQTRVVSPAPASPQVSDAQELDIMSLTPRLRDHGIRGVGSILALEAGPGQSTRFHLEIDSVVEAKRRVVVDQVMYGEPFAIGDRIYLLLDPENQNIVAVMPRSFTGGRKLDPKQRLDNRVLGPQLLREGARGQGTVLSMQRESAPVLESMGHAKVTLRMRIVPDDGSEAYEASQGMIYSSEEKLVRFGAVGAVMPVRYDRNDRMCFCADLLSLGFPDPYAEFAIADKARRDEYAKTHKIHAEGSMALQSESSTEAG